MTYWAQPLCFRALQHQLRMADINDGKGSLVWYPDNEWCWKCVPKNTGQWVMPEMWTIQRQFAHCNCRSSQRKFSKTKPVSSKTWAKTLFTKCPQENVTMYRKLPTARQTSWVSTKLKIVTSIVTEWRKLQSAESYPHKQVGFSKRLLPAAALGGEGGPS